MNTFEFKDYTIKYEESGKGEPIIFLHNGGTSHTIWDDVIDSLPNYKSFALDLLGYGESSKFEGSDDILQHVEILETFIQLKKLKHITLVGNCMGSAISLTYAMRHQDNVKALVLLNPLTYNTFAEGNLGLFLKLRRDLPVLSKPIYNLVGKFKLNNFVSKLSLKTQFGSIGRAKHLENKENLCACFTAEGQMGSLMGTLDDLVNYVIIDQYTPTKDFPPICTIWGLENNILSVKAGKKLNEKLQPKREEFLAGCGHLLMMEKPDEVANIINEFIAQAK